MDERYGTEHLELLQVLLEMQEDCAPIEMSIGCTVDNIVRKGIVLKDAPAVVISTLVRKGYTCSLSKNGMWVYKL